MASLGTRYNIGDRLHCNCFTDHNFSIKVRISAIADFDLAENRYESVMLKMFNSDRSQELYEEWKTSTVYYYICEVLELTEDYNAGDFIVLNDTLIREEGTYYLNQEASLYLNVSFSTVTNYKSVEELISDIEYYLTTKGVESVEVYEEMSYEEKLEHELNEYRSIIVSIKSLKGVEQLIDRMYGMFNTMISKMTNLLNLFNNKEDK